MSIKTHTYTHSHKMVFQGTLANVTTCTNLSLGIHITVGSYIQSKFISPEEASARIFHPSLCSYLSYGYTLFYFKVSLPTFSWGMGRRLRPMHMFSLLCLMGGPQSPKFSTLILLKEAASYKSSPSFEMEVKEKYDLIHIVWRPLSKNAFGLCG